MEALQQMCPVYNNKETSPLTRYMTNLMNETEYLYPEVLETLQIKCEIFLC